MAVISKVTTPDNTEYGIRAGAIPYGEVDATSTATAFTATVPGIYALGDGVCVFLRNGQITSASGFTLNINGLGAKPVYNNMATGSDRADPPTVATRDTTIFNVAYTMLFVYSTQDNINGGDGGWICYRGYDANTNTIGYQLRTNSTVMTVTDTARYYKLYFTSADGTQWVPASVNSTNNATATRAVNQRPIDPFGRIVYTSASTNYTAGSNLAATTLWDQYAFVLGYSFNRTGAALTLTAKNPVYIKCAPQSNGSAIIDATTPYVQALPTTADNKIYIFLGIAYDATHVELFIDHPVYYHDGNGIRLWTGIKIPTKVSELTNDSGFITSADVPEGSSAYTGTISAVSTTASSGTNNGFARGDHVHNITSSTITSALGYTPYNSTNPNGYTSNAGTVTGVKVNGTTKSPSSGVVDIGTVLTSYTETDPVFAASAAAGISSTDITNWNNKTSNVGTITGVTAGTGLSGSGTSGTVTVNHSNSVTAKTTQALYPIKFDSQGHITGSGDAVTSLPASDVSSWAKASTKPSYTASEVGALPSTTTYVSAVKVNGTALTPDSNKAVDVTVPLIVSSFQNDAGYQTASDVNGLIASYSESGNIVHILFVSGSSVALFSSDNTAVNIQTLALEYSANVRNLHIIQPLNQFSSLSDIHAREYYITDIDMPNVTVKLSAIDGDTRYDVTLTESGSGLVGTISTTSVAISSEEIAQGVIGKENGYGTNYVNWVDSNGDMTNLSVDAANAKLSINQYDSTEDDWTQTGSIDLNNVYSTDNKPTVMELDGCQRKYLSSAGTTTFTLTSAKIYLLVITKLNNSTANNSGLYIVQCHTASSVRTIASSAVATVSISGTTLTVTTSSTNVDIECIRLTP